MSIVCFERIDVAESTLEALVRVQDPAHLRTAGVDRIATRALELLPGLASHKCENDTHASFVAEMRDTETPHLLEHIAVELMVLSGSPRGLRARTTWDFARDGRGAFRITLPFDDDAVALGALRTASEIVDQLFGHKTRVDVGSAVEKLRALRV